MCEQCSAEPLNLTTSRSLWHSTTLDASGRSKTSTKFVDSDDSGCDSEEQEISYLYSTRGLEWVRVIEAASQICHIILTASLRPTSKSKALENIFHLF